MFDTIIVPLNGNPGAEDVIPLALDEATHRGASIVLVHVIARPEVTAELGERGGHTPASPSWSAGDLTGESDRATLYLEQVIERHRLGPWASHRVLVGNPGLQILKEIGRHPRAMVILTTREDVGFDGPRNDVFRVLMTRSGVPILAVRGVVGASDGTALDRHDDHPSPVHLLDDAMPHGPWTQRWPGVGRSLLTSSTSD